MTMFANLKSLLSNHISPGGSHVNVSPFSFPWGCTINVVIHAGPDAEQIEQLKSEIIRLEDQLHDSVIRQLLESEDAGDRA